MKKQRLLYFILVAVLLFIPVFGACGGEETTATATATVTATATKTATATGTTTATPTATATATSVTKPKPEGTFTYAASSLETQGYVPWLTWLADYLVYGNVYDSLALTTAEGDITPSVAESWEWNDSYTVLTLHLREGIQFQDGWGELTSADVKYMMEQTMAPGSPSGARSFMTIITSIEAPDDYTVVITQSEPNVDKADTYAFSPIYASIPCKKYIETVGIDEAMVHPIGSGPYKLVEGRTGDFHKFEALDDHWRCVPEFKYLIIKAVPEESTRVAMLRTGDIDATLVSASSKAQLLESIGFTVEVWPYGPNTDICFGGLQRPGTSLYKEGYHNQDPWADVRVREAMNIAIDRDAINKALHLGTAMPMTIVHQIPGWRDLPPIPYDPPRARQLLAEAAADGVFTPNANGGFHFRLVSAPSHPGTPMVAKEAEAVVGYWEEIGITCDIAPIDFPAYTQQRTNDNAGDCYTYRLTYGGYNPSTYLMQLNNADEHWGTRWQCDASDILTPMAQAALAEMDLAKRYEMYKEIAQVEYENWLGIPLMCVPYMMAKNGDKIGEWPPNSSSYYWNFCYVRHAEPLNTFHLFEVWD